VSIATGRSNADSRKPSAHGGLLATSGFSASADSSGSKLVHSVFVLDLGLFLAPFLGCGLPFVCARGMRPEHRHDGSVWTVGVTLATGGMRRHGALAAKFALAGAGHKRRGRTRPHGQTYRHCSQTQFGSSRLPDQDIGSLEVRAQPEPVDVGCDHDWKRQYHYDCDEHFHAYLLGLHCI